jgi:hypothetical protein
MQLYTAQSSSSSQIEPVMQAGWLLVNDVDTFTFSDVFAFGVRATISSGIAHS